jgi:hypothetical protein
MAAADVSPNAPARFRGQDDAAETRSDYLVEASSFTDGYGPMPDLETHERELKNTRQEVRNLQELQMRPQAQKPNNGAVSSHQK